MTETIGHNSLIRDIRDDDLDVIHHLHREAFAERAWTHDQLVGSLSHSHGHGLIIEKNGRTLGFILYHILQGEAEILTLAISTTARREHHATALVEATIKTIARNCHKIFLEVAITNSAAIRLYEKCGFRQNGRRKNYYQTQDGRVDALVMQKDLGQQ
jgi:[ribosomal protein S18]-alanine N-acetyltransferase